MGNYDDANMTINPSSSYLESSDVDNDKPEICAPGSNINAGYTGTWPLGTTITDSGTSMAAAWASGTLAAAMDAIPELVWRPQLARAAMMAGAIDGVFGGNDKTGFGGVDYLAVPWRNGFFWWEGGNGYFNTVAANDGGTNSSRIEVPIQMVANTPNGVFIAWLNRGTYTYAHRNDLHPIGTDLDLHVYDPNGNFVIQQNSFDNSQEGLWFWPQITGTYRIEISRPYNRDTSSPFRLGLVHKF